MKNPFRKKHTCIHIRRNFKRSRGGNFKHDINTSGLWEKMQAYEKKQKQATQQAQQADKTVATSQNESSNLALDHDTTTSGVSVDKSANYTDDTQQNSETMTSDNAHEAIDAFTEPPVIKTEVVYESMETEEEADGDVSGCDSTPVKQTPVKTPEQGK